MAPRSRLGIPLRTSSSPRRRIRRLCCPTSVDSGWSHLAFAKDRNLHFPLLADFEPKGDVARAYHVYRDIAGTSERALFVIDPDGVIRWSYVSPVGVNPGADGILRALEGLEERRETT